MDFLLLSSGGAFAAVIEHLLISIYISLRMKILLELHFGLSWWVGLVWGALGEADRKNDLTVLTLGILLVKFLQDVVDAKGYALKLPIIRKLTNSYRLLHLS